MRVVALLAALPLLALGAAIAPGRQAPAPAPTVSLPSAERDRSPSDVALSADGKRAVTANRTAGTLSVVALESGAVSREIPVGGEPFALALTPDGRNAAVSCLADDTLTLVPLDGKTDPVKLPVGDEPRGVLITPSGSRAWVALGGEDAVVEVALDTRKILRRISVPGEPWHLALAGKRLVVAATRGRSVTVIDTTSGKTLYAVALAGRNARQLTVSPDGKWAYVPFIAERLASATRMNIDRGWVVGNRLGRVPLTEDGPREAITLDVSENAVADLDGAALSPDGKTLALTAAGTHELLLLSRPESLPFVAYGGPGDHSESPTREALRRIPLGGAPKSVRFTADSKRLIIANYFGNSIQVVDVGSGKIVKTVALGGPSAPTLVREGEALFHDATRSFGNWYSCASCHVEGHTGGGSFDTLNDGGYGKPKKTPTLRGVTRTAPYTWHGWQKSLKTAIHDSFVNSMQGPEPSPRDVEAVEAYLATLEPRPSPKRADAVALRGKAVFKAKACNTCHGGPEFSSPIVSRIGLEEQDDEYTGFNPPSLRAVRTRAPYLHDGRAETLPDVLKVWHRPSKLTGKPDCTAAELSDLVAYLETL
jgi:DNA-binding beta-propeller fold protein YncE/cytochrome c553